MIIFYTPSNAICLSDKSVQINIFSIILSLVCVPCLLGSIGKYLISVNEDTSGLKPVGQM